MKSFFNLIPKNIDPAYKKTPKDFSRNRKLPFSKLIVFILSITASGKSKGIDSKSGEFFKNAKRSGLWPGAEAIHRSSLTKARKKISWTIFRDLLQKAVKLAYEIWPEDNKFLWHGMSVFATDGSRFTLPSTDEIRNAFDPQRGKKLNGHFPQCLVSTLYDVFRRLPVARTIVSTNNANEREEAKKHLQFIPSNSVWLFDKGYPSYDLILHLIENFTGYFVFRCPAYNSFPALKPFITSSKKDGIIWITPSNKYMAGIAAKDRKKCKNIKLRVVKLINPKGKISVLLTNLYDKKQFSEKEIIALYFRRWEIEGYYRDEKVVMEI
ncbi:MAG: IS4 family transposase, partial [Proteobacteria bacterium]|nr:IS4 family transposase [Pseudomonadota bacterium]